MILRQFCAPDGQLSYLFADPVTRYAAAIDPHTRQEQEYLEMIGHLGLRLEYTIETHAHESHLSASVLLKAETGAKWLSPGLAALDDVDGRFEDGDTVFIGEERIDVLHTPGHSPCSMSYLWCGHVFTGHTLLAGITGSCERPDSDAGQMFDSLQNCLFTLPATTVVLPGLLVLEKGTTSVVQERVRNKDCQPGTTREQFIRQKQAKTHLLRRKYEHKHEYD